MWYIIGFCLSKIFLSKMCTCLQIYLLSTVWLVQCPILTLQPVNYLFFGPFNFWLCHGTLQDYSEMSMAYRPSHADATYDFKYGVRSVQVVFSKKKKFWIVPVLWCNSAAELFIETLKFLKLLLCCISILTIKRKSNFFPVKWPSTFLLSYDFLFSLKLEMWLKGHLQKKSTDDGSDLP